MVQAIDVSIIATAHKPANWLAIWDSFVTERKIDFVFVGPNPSVDLMPENFHYHRARVKPAQGLEIALRNAIA